MRVMHHLAGCGQCREILSLATAESDSVPAPTLATTPSRTSWFSFSLLRWGTAGALAVIVGAAVMLRDQHKYASPIPGSEMAVPSAEKRTEQGLSTSPASTAVTKAPELAQPSPNATALTIEAKKLPEAPRAIGNPNAMSRSNEMIADASPPTARARDELKTFAPKSPAPATALSVQGRQVAKLDQKQSPGGFDYKSAGAQPPAVPSSAAAGGSEEVNPGKAKDELTTPAVAARIAAAKSGPQVAGAPPEESPAMNGRNQAVGQATESVEVTAAAPVLATSASSQGTLTKAKINRPAPRWTLSADGSLQRSYNFGKTWEKVPVSSGVTFRAFSVIGGDLWVGGANGALYHSSDSAQHWTQITPAANGATLTADIATIEFTDLQHGKIRTTTGETWTTSDAGQTWQKH